MHFIDWVRNEAFLCTFCLKVSLAALDFHILEQNIQIMLRLFDVVIEMP